VAEEPAHSKAIHVGLAFLVLIAGWAVPGLGHAMLRRWARAVVVLFSVGLLAAGGVLMGGYVFPPRPSDAFEWLGFLSNLGTGGFYFLVRWWEAGSADVSRAAGDYGTRFLATAGVLNLLSALDAHSIARGKKE
jgi:hypothetical protein